MAILWQQLQAIKHNIIFSHWIKAICKWTKKSELIILTFCMNNWILRIHGHTEIFFSVPNIILSNTFKIYGIITNSELRNHYLDNDQIKQFVGHACKVIVYSFTLYLYTCKRRWVDSINPWLTKLNIKAPHF